MSQRHLLLPRLKLSMELKQHIMCLIPYLLDDNILLLKEIASLGHEVTYHYDVLDSNNGEMNEH